MNRDYYSSNEILYLSVNKILPNPYQPRKNYNTAELEELAASIKRYGVLQPICVRILNRNIYELVIGERRLKASRMAGFDAIPAIIVDAQSREAAMLNMVENMQRADFNYMEEAEGIRIMRDCFKYSYKDISHITGKTTDYIEKAARLISLSNEMKNLMIDMKITRENALAVSQLEDEKAQEKVLKKVINLGLNTKRTEEVVNFELRKSQGAGMTENSHIAKRRKMREIRYLTAALNDAVAEVNSTGLETMWEICENNENTEINIKIKNCAVAVE